MTNHEKVSADGEDARRTMAENNHQSKESDSDAIGKEKKIDDDDKDVENQPKEQ